MGDQYEPAYPGPELRHDGALTAYNVPGVTILDYFAAVALQGLISGRNEAETYDITSNDGMLDCAKIAYGLAKAMVITKNTL